MMWQYLLLGIALVLVLEGIFPFVMPDKYREFLKQVIGQSDQTLRWTGLILMLCGVGLLFLVKQIYGI